jgi:GcrA cell cycle regulator
MIGQPSREAVGGWTPTRIDMLHRHFAAGMTAAQSADALGGVSRNAVLCKRLRLGLSRSDAPAGALAMLLAGGRYLPTEPPPLPCHPLPDMDLEPPADARPSRLFDKGRHACAWPLGPAEEPGDYRTLYCGAPNARRRAYCQAHADIARWRP